LNNHGLSWKYYTPNGQIQWNAPQALSKHYQSPNIVIKQAAVLTDIANCKLPNVAWVNPAGESSDHAGNPKGSKGPSWVASVVNAIGTSSCGYWANTAILVTWDDWGGWYDHVPPFRIGQPNGWGQSYVYGFRVPLLVISAYTPAGYVSNSVHDFGSMLRFAETNFNLGFVGPGTWADSYADDLGQFFSLSNPRTFAPIRSSVNASFFLTHVDTSDPDDE
jgi:phospholipase C